MHNVAFFSNHFARQTGTGIARYSRSLVQASAQIDSPFTIVPVATWSNRERDALAVLKSETGLRLIPTGRWLTPALWLLLGLPKLEHFLDISIDVVHQSYLGYLAATSKPWVVTIHDIGPLTHPQYFASSATGRLKRNLGKVVREAAAILCVSQATADSLMTYVSEHDAVDIAHRTHVVHEAAFAQFLQPPDVSLLNAIRQVDFSRPYILAVGKISPRKNLEAVIRALSNLKDAIPHHLLTVGGDGWDFEGVKSLVNRLGLHDRVHFLGYVSDETLHALYSNATLFIFPSLFEGFGLPVVEAMAAGCPVITSNVSSLPEVAGDAALLVDPHDVEQIASAMETLCTDQMLSDELRMKGKQRAELFSWQKCARETQTIYAGLVS